MRKIILLAVAIFALNTVKAQEKNQGLKGAWWGLASFNYSDDGADNTSFVILPAVGTFVSPDITVGAALGYISNKSGSADATNIVVFKPLARKYWGASDKFFIFAEASVPMLFNKNFNSYSINIEPGIDYFIGGKWTLEAKFGKVGYTSFNPKVGESVNSFNIGLNMFDSMTQEGLGSGLSLGLKYLF